MSPPPPDPMLLREGDPATTAAFRRIIYAHALRYFTEESVLLDVVQDALLELLAKLRAGAKPEHPVYWALTSANNAVRRELTRMRHQAIEFESQLHGALDGQAEADRAALLDARDDLRKISSLLAECDELPCRALAGAVEGRDHRELAEQLGVSPGAARMVLSRARAELSERLSAQEKLGRLISLAQQAGLVSRDQPS